MRANLLTYASVLCGIAGLMIAGGARAQSTETHLFGNVNLPIPDDDPIGVSDAQTVTSAITNITKLRVFVTLPGTWNGDIYAKLEHGSAFSILLNRCGNTVAGGVGYSDDGFDVAFEDGAANGDIHKYQDVIGIPPPGAALLTGTWAPDGRATSPDLTMEADPRTDMLAGFNGADANGDWDIHVVDAAGGDVHMLNHWTLVIHHADASIDTVESGEVALAVPDGDLGGILNTMAVTSSASPITDVDVILNLTGTYDGDLYAQVVHGGASAVLVNRVGRITSGFGYSDDGFDDVRFDDDAANGDVHIYRRTLYGSDSAGLPPVPAVTGVWEVDGRDIDPDLVTDADARTAFLSAFNGTDANGEWKLTVSDNAGGDTFVLAKWGIEVTGTAGVQGDTNGDGCIDDSDLTAVILDYGDAPSGNNGTTDVNGDGIVDDADITMVILNFGMGC